jgi:hypothetical protein
MVAVLCCPAQQNFICYGNSIPLRIEITAPKRLLLQEVPRQCKTSVAKDKFKENASYNTMSNVPSEHCC